MKSATTRRNSPNHSKLGRYIDISMVTFPDRWRTHRPNSDISCVACNVSVMPCSASAQLPKKVQTLELGRYLIAFEPLTFVLDQRKHSWQMLSPRSVLRRSKHFTSNVAIGMPPSVPIDHYLGDSENQQNRTEVLVVQVCLVDAKGRNISK